MSDDKTKKGKADRIRINVHEDHEVAYWTKKLRCSRFVLANAVSVVGPMVTDVTHYLDNILDPNR